MALLFYAIGNYSVMFHSIKNAPRRILFNTVNKVKQQGKPAKYERRF